jgi:hypothetical protein
MARTFGLVLLASARRGWRSYKAIAIVFNEHTHEDGAIVFRHACKLGLVVSTDWIKVKHPDSRQWPDTNPGRRSTYRRGKVVQTTGTSSPRHSHALLLADLW